MGQRARILVAEDDPIVRSFIQTALSDSDFSVRCVGDGKMAIDALKRSDFDLVFTDLKMPRMDGMEVLKNAKQLHPQMNVVIGTAFGTVDVAVKAMRMGAFDMLTKPFSPEDLIEVVKRALQKESAVQKSEPQYPDNFKSQLIGDSVALQNIRSLIAKVAESSATILIEGETGTGKEVIADVIHNSSHRKNKKIVKINCAALPETLIESELFGYEKGAFTGAYTRTRGRFELADGGTILLDEIGELNMPMQAKLLRVLQNKTFERLGNGNSVNVDARIIATTNRDLRQEVREGKFRKDLYFRLSVVQIFVPPLRDRVEDIPTLAQHFLNIYNHENKTQRIFGPKVIDEMVKYDWPGNVRELQNCVEKAVVTTNRDRITVKDLHFNDFHDLVYNTEESLDDLTIYEAERRLIMNTLKRTSFHKTKAAEALGISVRTLRNKLHEYAQQDVIGK